MIVVHGSVGGFPEFAEVIQMFVVENNLSFIVKQLSAWYREQVSVIQLAALIDQYPLADYRIGGQRMVTPKRLIHIEG